MAKTNDTAGDATMPKGEIADDLRDLVSTLKGDLTKLAGPKADKALAHWEGLLEKVGPGAKSIHGDLGKLREQLSGEPDGKAIGKLLTSLSTKTAKVAEDQGGVIGTALKSLSSALEKGAASLDESDGAGKKSSAK